MNADIELVAILRGLTPARAPEVGAALVGCGFRTIEVPLNSPDPFDTIELLAQAHGASCLIGAGTVLTPAEVDRVHAAGGRLVVAPNCDGDVIRRALELGPARAAWYRYRDRGVRGAAPRRHRAQTLSRVELWRRTSQSTEIRAPQAREDLSGRRHWLAGHRRHGSRQARMASDLAVNFSSPRIHSRS